MNSFFLHQPFFRLLSPLLVGSLAYLLILLLNNNVEQLQAQFLGAELYFCWTVALVVQEISRIVVAGWPGRWLLKHPFWQVGSVAIVAFLMSVLATILAVGVYFKWALGYLPERSEWLMFIGVFSFFAIIQLSLYLSHHFLAQAIIRQLAEEEERKENTVADFNQFKNGINPDLLFESLEALIVCLHRDRDAADDLLNQLSSVYRYILGGRAKELVPIAEELHVLQDLLGLFNQLPYRKIELEPHVDLQGWVVPGALLTLVERIMRSSIVFQDQALSLVLESSDSHFLLRYQAVEKITQGFQASQLDELRRRYQVYSDRELILENSQQTKVVGIPIVFVD